MGRGGSLITINEQEFVIGPTLSGADPTVLAQEESPLLAPPGPAEPGRRTVGELKLWPGIILVADQRQLRNGSELKPGARIAALDRTDQQGLERFTVPWMYLGMVAWGVLFWRTVANGGPVTLGLGGVIGLLAADLITALFHLYCDTAPFHLEKRPGPVHTVLNGLKLNFRYHHLDHLSCEGSSMQSHLAEPWIGGTPLSILVLLLDAPSLSSTTGLGWPAILALTALLATVPALVRLDWVSPLGKILALWLLTVILIIALACSCQLGCAVVVACIFWIQFVQVAHRFAHRQNLYERVKSPEVRARYRVPWLWLKLQRLGLFLPAAHHNTHHQTETCNFAILNGIADPVLNWALRWYELLTFAAASQAEWEFMVEAKKLRGPAWDRFVAGIGQQGIVPREAAANATAAHSS